VDSADVSLACRRIESDQHYFIDLLISREELFHFLHSDGHGAFRRKAIRTGTDRREGDAANSMFANECKAAAIATGEQIIFTAITAVPDRADPCVLDKFLGYLGAGHDPPQKSLVGSSGLYCPRPHDEVDRMPEYEHILSV
jgi:hypothetical protein